MQQQTKEWLEMRKDYIGSSDAPIIMGVSPWTTPFQLWEEKLGLGEEKEENWAMKMGKEMEPIARQAYIEHTGIYVEDAVFFDPLHDFRMASLDGLSLDKKTAVEIKNANETDHALALEGRIPEKYYPQCQHILDVTNAEMLHYWSFRNGTGALVKLIKDEKYCEKLIQKEREFREKVVNFSPPPFTEKDYVDYVGESEFEALLKEAREIKALENEVKKRKEANREKFHDKLNGRNGKGQGGKFFKVVSPGRINTGKLIEHLGIEKKVVDQFRSDPIIKWTFLGKSEKKEAG